MNKFRYWFFFFALGALVFTSCSIQKNLSKSQYESKTKGDAIMGIEHGPCKGTCPNFKVDIYKSGIAVYEGLNFVDLKGKYYRMLDKATMDQIKELFESVDYFSLEDDYDEKRVSDLPATITYYQKGNQFKKVRDYDTTPKKVIEMEKKLDEILDVKNKELWLKLPK